MRGRLRWRRTRSCGSPGSTAVAAGFAPFLHAPDYVRERAAGADRGPAPPAPVLRIAVAGRPPGPYGRLHVHFARRLVTPPVAAAARDRDPCAARPHRRAADRQRARGLRRPVPAAHHRDGQGGSAEDRIRRPQGLGEPGVRGSARRVPDRARHPARGPGDHRCRRCRRGRRRRGRALRCGVAGRGVGRRSQLRVRRLSLRSVRAGPQHDQRRDGPRHRPIQGSACLIRAGQRTPAHCRRA